MRKDFSVRLFSQVMQTANEAERKAEALREGCYFTTPPKKRVDFRMSITCQDADPLVSSFKTRVGNRVADREMVHDLSLLGIQVEISLHFFIEERSNACSS